MAVVNISMTIPRYIIMCISTGAGTVEIMVITKAEYLMQLLRMNMMVLQMELLTIIRQDCKF